MVVIVRDSGESECGPIGTDIIPMILNEKRVASNATVEGAPVLIRLRLRQCLRRGAHAPVGLGPVPAGTPFDCPPLSPGRSPNHRGCTR
eukprot:6167828-Pyramimonas_sp.AAC.1